MIGRVLRNIQVHGRSNGEVQGDAKRQAVRKVAALARETAGTAAVEAARQALSKAIADAVKAGLNKEDVIQASKAALPQDGGTAREKRRLNPRLGLEDVQSDVPYRLQVTLVLEKQHVKGLLEEGAAAGLTAMHAPAGLSLLHSAWNFDAVDGDEKRVTIYNVWGMFDADSLLRAELLLPDEPMYAQFQQHVITEEKDIILPVVPRTLDKPGSFEFDYLRIEKALRLPKVAEFAARLEAKVIPFCDRNGWAGGQAFFSLTGRTGAITQLWKVPKGTSLQDAEAVLAREAWSDAKLFDPNYKPRALLLSKTPGDPTAKEEGVKFHAA